MLDESEWTGQSDTRGAVPSGPPLLTSGPSTLLISPDYTSANEPDFVRLTVSLL